MKSLRRLWEEARVNPHEVDGAPRYCPQCGQVPATAGAAFCGKCGGRLVVQAAQFGGLLTPSFTPGQQRQRIGFACFAAPLIGIVLGGPFFEWLVASFTGLFGEPVHSLFFRFVGTALTIGLVAYIILSDQTALLNKIVTRLRRREMPAPPHEPVNEPKRQPAPGITNPGNSTDPNFVPVARFTSNPAQNDTPLNPFRRKQRP